MFNLFASSTRSPRPPPAPTRWMERVTKSLDCPPETVARSAILLFSSALCPIQLILLFVFVRREKHIRDQSEHISRSWKRQFIAGHRRRRSQSVAYNTTRPLRSHPRFWLEFRCRRRCVRWSGSGRRRRRSSSPPYTSVTLNDRGRFRMDRQVD